MREVDFGDGIFVTLFFLAVILAAGTIGGCTDRLSSRAGFEKEAVSHGAATFEKRADGEIIFRWKDVK